MALYLHCNKIENIIALLKKAVDRDNGRIDEKIAEMVKNDELIEAIAEQLFYIDNHLKAVTDPLYEKIRQANKEHDKALETLAKKVADKKLIDIKPEAA